MGKSIVTITQNVTDNEEVNITLDYGAEHGEYYQQIEDAIYRCFLDKKYKIVLDLNNIKYPPTKLISLFIEAANQARRLGGYLKPINLGKSTENNLMSFNAASYLSLSESEAYAIFDYDEELAQEYFKKSAKVNPIGKSPKTVTSDSNARRDDMSHGAQVGSQAISTMTHPIKIDTIRARSEIDSLYEICDFVTLNAKEAGLSSTERGKIKVTAYEACLNVIEHAYFSNPENWIEVTVSYDKEKLFILIHDWGQGFDFSPKKEYNVELAVQNRKTGGFGLHIIRRSVDDIEYDSHPELGNRLLLVKFLDRHRVA
ncbi:ATP-binding protein [candidate division KSB1 bacterium]|nr:ATP-binding protein [candidate division KSB1 bacterium]